MVGNPRAGSFTKSLHLCGGVRCDVQERGFSWSARRCGTAGSVSRETVWLNHKRCRVSIIYLKFSNFSPCWHIHHEQRFQINHKPSSVTSFHGDPAALRRRQRQDEGRILWVLHENKRKKVSWLPEYNSTRHIAWHRNWAWTTKTHFFPRSISVWVTFLGISFPWGNFWAPGAFLCTKIMQMYVGLC